MLVATCFSVDDATKGGGYYSVLSPRDNRMLELHAFYVFWGWDHDTISFRFPKLIRSIERTQSYLTDSLNLGNAKFR